MTAALILIAGALMPNRAWAAADVPATAQKFAVFCTPLNDACRSKIIGVQMDSSFSTPPATDCEVPDGIEHEEGYKAIVSWLSAHPETASMSTEDGINAAIKALWNCQKSIATGHTSWGAPDKIGAFVTFCADAKNYVICANQIVEASTNAYAAQALNGKSDHCSAPDGVETKELTVKVLAWLKDHTEVNGQDTGTGITAAIDHLWPCH
jgi:Tfp pilus assembly protein PilW